MQLFARRLGGSISAGARERLTNLQSYPTLETWRNPLTRSIARHFAHEAWLKTLNEIDFEYRLTDLDIAGVPCVRYETRTTRPGSDIILYVHGGAFVAGSPHVNAAMILPTCELSGKEAIGVDYSLLPEARFPVALDQVDAVYRTLVKQDATRRITLFADSIGCTLILANMLRWRDENIKMPSGTVFVCPVIDGKGASDTHITLDGFDPLIRTYGGRVFRKLFEYYAPDARIDDPLVSPIYGDFESLPPMLIHVGSREVCLGDAARLSEKARLAGVPVSLRVFDGMFHLFHMHWSVDEAKTAHEDIAEFIGAKTNRTAMIA